MEEVKRGGRLGAGRSLLVAGLSAVILFTTAIPARALTITEYAVPTAGSFLLYIAAGPDGNLWFTEYYGHQVGRITPQGAMTEFPLGVGGWDIAPGPDGNVWFTEPDADNVGRITPDGSITVFNLGSGTTPYGITTGPDGNLWITAAGKDAIVRMTPTGEVTGTFYTHLFAFPVDIVTGPDGNLWFSEDSGNEIGRISETGQIVEFPIPTPYSHPDAIAAGPDGNVWFTEHASNHVAKITPEGVITEFSIPRQYSAMEDLVAFRGKMWVADYQSGRLIWVTSSGQMGSLIPPTARDGPWGIAVGPDGRSLWFTESEANQIGAVEP